MEINKEDLEKVCKSIGRDEENCNCEDKCENCECEKEEEIGFHKGSLNTLVAERNELVKMIGNVEAIMQAHLKRLEELGVKIESKKAD
jgi:hypothetical protein